MKALLQILLFATALTQAAPASAQVASYPFQDGFEGPTLAPHWKPGGTTYAFSTVTKQETPYSGSQHLHIGSSQPDGELYSYVDLAIDLEGRHGVHLEYMLKHLSGSALSEEGLYLSEDGKVFYKVFEEEPFFYSKEYNHYVFDLDSLAQQAGLKYTKQFSIRFQYHGYDVGPGKGLTLDDLRVYPAGLAVIGQTYSESPIGLGNFGAGVASAGDLNGDGYSEFAFGHPGYNLKRGRVELYDGKTFAYLSSFTMDVYGERFGDSLANVGDLDGDGFDELLVGAPSNDTKALDGGAAYVYSTQKGIALFSLYGTTFQGGFGAKVLSAPDYDGDGKSEFLVASPYTQAGGEEGAGRVELFRGSNASLWRTFEGDQFGQALGSSMDAFGDFDGDGTADLLLGSPGWSAVPASGDQRGAVLCFSGATGDLVRTFVGPADDSGFGSSVASIQDQNGDGVAELAAGAPDLNSGTGAIQVLSGLDGGQLHFLAGEEIGERFGSCVTRANNVDGFGTESLLAGTDSPGYGYIKLIGLPTYEILKKPAAVIEDTGFGSIIVSAGDLNGDDVDDLILGEPRDDFGKYKDAGYVRVVSTIDGPELDDVVSVHCTQAGEAIVTGNNFVSSTIVSLDGQVVAATPLSNHELRIPLGVDVPGGFSDLEITTELGTLLVPEGLARYPAVGCDPTVLIGESLSVRIDNGEPGSYILAFSNATFSSPAPFEAMGWYHGLELAGVWIASAGVFTPGETARELVMPGPSSMLFLGTNFHLQAWTWQATSGMAGFSNVATTTATQ